MNQKTSTLSLRKVYSKFDSPAVPFPIFYARMTIMGWPAERAAMQPKRRHGGSRRAFYDGKWMTMRAIYNLHCKVPGLTYTAFVMRLTRNKMSAEEACRKPLERVHKKV